MFGTRVSHIESLKEEIRYLRDELAKAHERHAAYVEARQHEIIALADRRATYDIINARDPPPHPVNGAVRVEDTEPTPPWMPSLVADGHLDPIEEQVERERATRARLRGEPLAEDDLPPG